MSLQEFVGDLQSEWLGDHAVDVFGPSPPAPGGTTGYHLLCAGRLVQHLPWEAIPVLHGQAVGRTPSLSFSVAHNILQRARKRYIIHPPIY